MFEIFGQFDQLLAGMCGVFAGALGCWLVQKTHGRQQQRSTEANTPAIQAAAQANTSHWSEPERLLLQIHELFVTLGAESAPAKLALTTLQGQQTVRQFQAWITLEKNSSRTAQQDDTAAALKQRAADDELVLQWLHENPGSLAVPHHEAPRCAAPELAHPELALSQIASELLPFNPIAVRLIGKSAEPDMMATVERIEKLLASVDPPESLAKPPAGMLGTSAEPAAAIRDPNSRVNIQAEDPQRRRSDQPIIYDTLLRRCLGDDDFAWRMLHKFPQRCRAELDSLGTELRRRAWTAATRRINQLRGMAANIAAENLRDALANLENVCRMQSAMRADQLLEAVHGEFHQFLDFLARGEGICRLEHRTSDENRPVSRWPAGYLTLEEQHSPSNSEHHSASANL